jgi:hypothetical protein
VSAEGARQFARYAYPPNELGYCGPDGAEAMLDPSAVSEIERRARLFDGAWVYLEFLAEALGSNDPLSSDVVEAYWIGNDVLDDLDPAALMRQLNASFADQRGGTWRQARRRARAHHSFQVFEVYPWSAMLSAGMTPGPAVSVLDRCRIRTGLVTSVDGEFLSVTTRLLGWHGSTLDVEKSATERVRWAIEGRSLLSTSPIEDDLVTLHWDWVCEVVTEAQVDQIERRETTQLELIGLR